MSLEQVVHRIASDPAFAAAVEADVEAAILNAGIYLEQAELEALKITLDKLQKRGPASIIWYESQLSHSLSREQTEAIIWYESQLGSEVP